MAHLRSLFRVALRHPSAIPAMVGLGWASRREGWWRRPPFLPLPPTEYLAWRAETAWGDAEGTGPDELVVRYLQWSREMRRRQRAAAREARRPPGGPIRPPESDRAP